MDAKLVGDCIRRNMVKKNLTSEMLSVITGITVERLKEYEEGNLKSKAKSNEIFAIAEAVGHLTTGSHERRWFVGISRQNCGWAI